MIRRRGGRKTGGTSQPEPQEKGRVRKVPTVAPDGFPALFGQSPQVEQARQLAEVRMSTSGIPLCVEWTIR